MDNVTLGVCQVSRLNSGGACPFEFTIHDHRGLAHALHCRSVRGVAFRVSRRVATKGGRPLALNSPARDCAMSFEYVLAALKTLIDGGAALRARVRLHMLVIGVIAADGRIGFGPLVSRIVNYLFVDRPQHFL